MWNTRNISCEGLTKLFYQKLLEGGVDEDSHRKVAESFHDAVKRFRAADNENPLL
jgi:hypothetical protein